MARPTLRSHRKFRRLVEDLGIPEAYVLGHLELMWGVSYESGDAYLGDARDVEIAAGWRGQPGQLTHALLTCGGDDCSGLIEEVAAGRYAVHDLEDHAPDYVQKRWKREQEKRDRGARIRAERTPLVRTNGRRSATADRTAGDESYLSAANGATPAPAPAPAPSTHPLAAAEADRRREGEERVGDPTRNPDSPAREAELDEPTAEDLAIGEYVAAIERAWTAQGGSILLRNEDWRLAQAWHREGRPLHLVLEAIGLVFARRRDRGEADRVNSLRYLAQEIDKQWRLWRQMTATGERDANSPELDLPARLRNLSLAAPADLAPRILELRAEADSEAVEAALSALDAKMLGSARESLAADQEAEIRTAIQRTLDSFGNRLDPEGVVTTRERLWATLLRDRLHLPHLSLFSPVARAVEAVADPPRHDAGEDSSPRSPADVFTGADRRLEEGP